LSWRFFGQDRLKFDADDHREESNPDKYTSASIIITTFEQVRLLRVRNQRLLPDWNVWFDDPDVGDFSDLETYDEDVWGELTERQKNDKGMIQIRGSGREYFKRGSRLSLGASVSRLRCVYTPPELPDVMGQ
jgi:hypothetical protein